MENLSRPESKEGNLKRIFLINGIMKPNQKLVAGYIRPKYISFILFIKKIIKVSLLTLWPCVRLKKLIFWVV